MAGGRSSLGSGYSRCERCCTRGRSPDLWEPGAGVSHCQKQPGNTSQRMWHRSLKECVEFARPRRGKEGHPGKGEPAPGLRAVEGQAVSGAWERSLEQDCWVAGRHRARQLVKRRLRFRKELRLDPGEVRTVSLSSRETRSDLADGLEWTRKVARAVSGEAATRVLKAWEGQWAWGEALDLGEAESGGVKLLGMSREQERH